MMNSLRLLRASGADRQSAWTKLVDAFPFADAAVSEAAIFQHRHDALVSAALAIAAIDWAKANEEVAARRADGSMQLTAAGQDRWHARHFSQRLRA